VSVSLIGLHSAPNTIIDFSDARPFLKVVVRIERFFYFSGPDWYDVVASQAIARGQLFLQAHSKVASGTFLVLAAGSIN
jgi:hypothetical protein